MPPRRRASSPPSVVDAVRAELEQLPEPLRGSASATAALGLARALDEVPTEVLFRFQGGLVSQLLVCMAELRERAGMNKAAVSEREEEPSPVADLTAVIAARGRPATR